jgi:hypothetical protein
MILDDGEFPAVGGWESGGDRLVEPVGDHPHRG